MDVQKVNAIVERGSEHPVKENVKFDEFCIREAKIYETDYKIVHNIQGTTAHINSIYFYKCCLVEFPRANILLDLCKNLTSLAVVECNLTKITREDLQGLGSLKELYLGWNAIEKLPNGLFDFTPNLEIVVFWRNKIKEIDGDILEPLKKLKFFNLSGNVAINVKYDAINNEGNVTLDQLKEEIKKCRSVEEVINDMRAEMRKEIDKLKKEKDFEIAALKKENATLKGSNEALKRKYKELEQSFNELRDDVKRLEMKEEPIEKDFTVTVNGKIFQVSKEILAANSPVLKRMIEENRDADHLELHDISEKTFEDIISYMNTKRPPNNAANLLELFAASAKLEMKKLREMTAAILMDKVTPENAPDIIKLCQKYRHEELGKKALEVLSKSFLKK